MYFHNMYAADKKWLLEFLGFKCLANAVVNMGNQWQGSLWAYNLIVHRVSGL